MNLKYIQAAPAAQFQKNDPIEKWAKELDVSPKKTYGWLTNT